MCCKEWEGYVIEIGKKTFTARLLDLTAGASVEEEEAVIPLSDLSEEEQQRLRLGTIFRWGIGSEEISGGSQQTVSQFYFLQEVMTADDLARAQRWGRAY